MNRYKILGYGLAAAIGLGTGAAVAIPKIYDRKAADSIAKAKNTIKTIAPDKFEKFQKEEKELGLFDSKTVFWRDALIQVDELMSKRSLKGQDPLRRIDSLIKKAYQDGAQMVRDSIKNASKIK